MKRFNEENGVAHDSGANLLLSLLTVGFGSRIILMQARPDDDVDALLDEVFDRIGDEQKHTLRHFRYAGDRKWLWQEFDKVLGRSEETISLGDHLSGKGYRTTWVEKWTKTEEPVVAILSRVDSWSDSDWMEFRELARRYISLKDITIVVISQSTHDVMFNKIKGIPCSRRTMAVPFLDQGDAIYLLEKHAPELKMCIDKDALEKAHLEENSLANVVRMLLEVGEHSLCGVRDLILQLKRDCQGMDAAGIVRHLGPMVRYKYALDPRRKKSNWH